MSTALISARIPTHHKATMDELPGKLSEHINLAIASYVESLRAPAKVERIPTAKKKKVVHDLTKHSKARIAVYKVFASSVHGHFTSSDIFHYIGMPTPNAAKRITELASMGYLAHTGAKRKSRDSNNMLDVWKFTGKPLPNGVVI